MTLRERLLRWQWILSAQFGLDPLQLVRSLRGLPRYIGTYRQFRALYHGPLELVPCLHDWREQGGTARGEYFWQDLLVARMIAAAAPQKHVDVGSRVDGFVAHVASFRDIEVFDVRPVMAQIPGVRFTQADLMNPLDHMDGYCDSLSCLHALEHFGLGRYGDPIDARGFQRGLASMAKLLRTGGTLYLSVPVGMPRVEFNAQVVHDPRSVIDAAKGERLLLERFAAVSGVAEPQVAPPDDAALATLAAERYVLGLFIFRKT